MTTAWLAGGSGLVGGVLLRRLLDDPGFERVISVGRRGLPLEHPKLTQVVADFGSAVALGALPPAEVVFCCLGSTIKKAGSRPAFRAVDHGAVLAFARAAKEKGARVLVHVSSMGADPASRIFYNAVKGEAERDAAQVGLPSVYAIRPSMLDGEREERRPAEQVGLLVMRALGPLLGKYRASPVEKVASAMIAAAKAAAPGSHVVEADAILRS
jgi:uncharacterized protein YbjT (DUF2867 family)